MLEERVRGKKNEMESERESFYEKVKEEKERENVLNVRAPKTSV